MTRRSLLVSIFWRCRASLSASQSMYLVPPVTQPMTLCYARKESTGRDENRVEWDAKMRTPLVNTHAYKKAWQYWIIRFVVCPIYLLFSGWSSSLFLNWHYHFSDARGDNYWVLPNWNAPFRNLFICLICPISTLISVPPSDDKVVLSTNWCDVPIVTTKTHTGWHPNTPSSKHCSFRIETFLFVTHKPLQNPVSGRKKTPGPGPGPNQI